MTSRLVPWVLSIFAVAIALTSGGVAGSPVELPVSPGAEGGDDAAGDVYFPPPEADGGWRALVSANETPTAQEQARIRAATGLDWMRLREAWKYLESFDGPDTVVIIRHGWIAGEWHDYTNPRGIASCTKSLTSLAVGKLIEMSAAGRFEKRIALDDPVSKFLPASWLAGDERRGSITIRHFLTMSSGLDPYDGPYRDLEAYGRLILTRGVEAPPGKVWAYASAPVDLLSLVVEDVTGRRMGDFFNEHIARPAGLAPIEFPTFGAETDGIHSGGSGGPRGGARLPARDLARLGYLMLHDGTWRDASGEKQVFAAETVRRHTRWAPQLATATYREPNFAFEKDAQNYYGYLWWTNRSQQSLGRAVPADAFYMSGWGKQICCVIPSLDMVVVRLGPNRALNDHPEYYPEFLSRVVAAVVPVERAVGAPGERESPSASRPVDRAAGLSRPFDGKRFRGRIAYSSDGNFNDEDDWAASPVALAILAACGVKDRLVHFDYNSILPDTDARWEAEHAASVVGAAERFGYPAAVFHDCRRDLDGAIASIARAVDASSAEDPLYFIIAGPMEVPFRALEKSRPEKRPFVYAISHSRWNDGFDRQDRFRVNKRSIIALGVRWIQITDQNQFLSTSPYGRPANDAEWEPWHWMRDSPDAGVRFLWERMRATKRADCSDAGMAYFLLAGDERSEIGKLRRLLEEKSPPVPVPFRERVRLEAENFRTLSGFMVDYENDRRASHRISVRLEGAKSGRIETPFADLYAPSSGTFDIEIRFSSAGAGARFGLRVNGASRGEWTAAGEDAGWTTHRVDGVTVREGDIIAVEVEARSDETVKLDYVHLEYRGAPR